MKNLMKKTIAAAATALCVGAGLQAYAATGDIWSVVPCDENGVQTAAYTTSDNPFDVGKAFYVRVRLWNHRYRIDPTSGDAYYTPWVRAYEDASTVADDTQAALDWAQYRPVLGVYANGIGEPKNATLVKVDNTSNEAYTDLIFEYDSAPGDLAMPIRLAKTNGTDIIPDEYTGSEVDGSQFYIHSDKFTFYPYDPVGRTNLEQKVVWSVAVPDGSNCADGLDATGRANYWPESELGAKLAGEPESLGFYVKTVDFDPNWEDEENGVWRLLHEDDIEASSLSLYVKARPEASVPVYLWSEDESSFVVTNTPALARNGVTVATVPMQVGWDASAGLPITKTFQVATIPINSVDDVNFALYGVKQGTTANLVLSAWPHYNYRGGSPASRINDYLTVPVSVGEPRETTMAVTGPTVIYATSNRFEAASTKIAVNLTPATKPATNDFTITLLPTVSGGGNWKDYVFFSRNPTLTSAAPPSDGGEAALTVTLKKGATASDEPLYVYALRSDAGNTILTLTPDFANPDGFVTGSPTELSATIKTTLDAYLAEDISPTKNVAADIKIGVGDAWADEQAGAAGGYLLQVRPDAEDEDNVTTFNGLFLQGGVLYEDLTTTPYTLPKITFENELQTTSAFRVISPVGNADTGWIEFTHVVKTKDVTVTVPGEDGSRTSIVNVEEGATVEATIANPANKDETLYAFLVADTPPNAVESGWFPDDCTWIVGSDYAARIAEDPAKGKGVPVEPGATSTPMSITALTAFSADFRVVLCTADPATGATTYDANRIYASFPSTVFTMNVGNVSAVGTGMWMYMDKASIDPEDKDEDGDNVFSEPVMYGTNRAFRVRISDSDYDKANGMVVKWTVRKVGATKDETLNVDGAGTRAYRFTAGGTPAVGAEDPAAWFEYTFTAATNYYVTAEVWDRYDYPGADREADYPGTTVTKMVQVAGLSAVKVSTSFENADGDNILSEDATGSQTVTVELGNWTDEAEVVVELAVSPKNPNEGNTGKIVFGDMLYSTDGVTNFYRHTFHVGNYEPWVLDIDLDELDGVAKSASSTKGFDLTARVLTTDELPSKQMAANRYYTVGSLKKTIKIVNAAPLLDGLMPTDAETSIYTNMSKDASIEWGTVIDVNADMTAFWTNRLYGSALQVTDNNYPSGTGIVVVVRGDNVVTTNFFTGRATSGTITPSFVNGQSIATLYFDFYDKDGSRTTAGPYIFPAVKTKILTTAANWPSGGNSMIPISAKYASAKGVGSGHTYVSGATFTSAENFFLTWDCGTQASTVMAYAFGYDANALDNGRLNKNRDIWINGSGDHARNAADPGSGYFHYNDETYGSFFYGWISAGEPGGTDYTLSVNPEMGTNVTNTAKVALPTEKSDDESGYVETYVEAIFSREHDQYDNMGDINDDGVPDYYMLFPNWQGGALATAEGDGAELAAIGARNDDDDFYPATPHTGVSSIVPGAVSGWQTSGQPFTVSREIRGYHAGLNFGMFQFNRDERVKYGWVSEIFLSENEKKALLRNVFERRDYLLKKLYTTGKLSTIEPENEVKELGLVTNLLSKIYYKGASQANSDNLNDRLFYADRGYIDSNLTAGLEREIIDEDGEPDTVPASAWIRTFTPYGADEPVTVTNFVELVAYTNVNDETDIHYLSPCDLYSFDDVDLGNWLEKENNALLYADQQATAKAYIDYTWRHFQRNGTWGFTVENRTDPTTDDTDGDGMPDGYEYYMWYAATVGTGEEQLTGSRFNLSDLEDYETKIAPRDIASAYNPNVAGSWNGRDTDNDGIYDEEEFLIGSSPVHWDTDRDGLSDLYEVMYNISPLDGGDGQNGSMNGDGDFMAFWRATAGDPLGSYAYVYAATNGTYWILDTMYAGNINTNKAALTVSGTGFEVKPFNGGYILPTENTADYAKRHAVPVTIEFDPKKKIVNTTVSLYHHQVHNYFGFDPRTGWFSNDDGSLASRWKRDDGSVYEAGKAMHTSKYTAISEYRLLKYRYIVGLRDLAGDLDDLRNNKTTIANIISAGTTNPNANYEGKTWGDSTTTYSKDQHGADTDGDAVPDGWELYIGVNPNIQFTIPKGSPGYDTLYWDGTAVWPLPIGDAPSYNDGLGLSGEYAGTDSCGAFEACESIYANHPSKGSGWFNKFFPTDPRNSDTDGDGLNDGMEGSKSWGGTYNFNRWGQTASAQVKYFGIYGDRTSATGRCTPGGGYNPCSIDTDLDGLPDPWERQFAGLLFHNNEPVEVVDDSRVLPVSIVNSSLYDDFRAAAQAHWGVYSNDTDNVYHIMMGMDGTVSDATSSTLLGSADRDWDGDGLQNWQEYMVQAMRHLRYDDSRTPLMGRDCAAFDAGTGKIEPGQWNGDNGYLRFSYVNPFSADDYDALVAAGYPNFAEFVKATPNYLGMLGYFAAPPKSWDHAGVDVGNKYMLPPHVYRDMVFEIGFEEQAVDEDGNFIWMFEGSDMTYTGAVQYVEDATYAPYMYGDIQLMMAVEPLMVPITTTRNIPSVQGGSAYVGTDPRHWDTDMDGMDDYYELYHGLNPLLGSVGSVEGEARTQDVISSNLGIVSAWRNAWTGWDNDTPPVFDPIRFPWLMGAAECDADGDGLRNNEEALLANVASPTSAHTDPTPLWMTDATVPDGEPFVSTTTTVVTNFLEDAAGNPVYWFVDGKPERKYTDIVETVVTNSILPLAMSPSYTALYYGNELTASAATGSVGGDPDSPGLATAWSCESYKYLSSFEQNEGYDTDNDWRTDSAEIKSLSRKNSDPLDFNDPARRQSIWFGGSADPGVAISYMPASRSVGGADFFKQFTVEAWIRPESSLYDDGDKYVVSRASRYGAWDLETGNAFAATSNAFIRINFALGIDGEGRIFAETQNATDLSSRATGEKAIAGKWVHVAATYDGEQLKLYRDGKLEASADTTLIPANGVVSIMQSPESVARFPYDIYTTVPSATIIGGRANGDGAFDYSSAAEATGWDDVATDFFQGRVAEVRTWDGARTAAEIASDYNVAYSVDDVIARRRNFYIAWRSGYSRNDNDDRETLPAELVQYYNMATLPGATDASFVRVEPTGFAANVLGYARNPEDAETTLGDSLKVGWWNALVESPVASKVYTSGHVVPWIQNMMGHLPRLCGSIADSVFWSENFAGYTPASFQRLGRFEFPNTMNPYTLAERNFEETYLNKKFANMVWASDGVNTEEVSEDSVVGSAAASLWWAYRYDSRMSFDGTSDLVPLGSAFAKRGEDYWDGNGAESAWQETGKDENANDLPDWWEEYAKTKYGAGDDLAADTEIVRNGATMTAYEAYIRDLAAGMLPTKTVNTAYLNRDDINADGLPDWWTGIYGVKGGAADDDDNDGLSNYTEFLLSEYFDLGVTFSPIKSKSVSLYDSDYFFRVGQLYAGEIFTDHDFMEDTWEDEEGADYATRYAWDANFDNDEDGWSNFAECRYSQFTAGILASHLSHVLGNEEFKDMPIPTLKLTLRYNASQPLTAGAGSDSAGASGSGSTGNEDANSLAPIVVQTFTRDGLVVPDATFNIRPGEKVDSYRYLGMWAKRTVRGTLAPGYVDSNSVGLEFMSVNKNDLYVWRLYSEDGLTSSLGGGTYEEYLMMLGAYGSYGVTYSSGPGRVELVMSDSQWLASDKVSVTTDDTTENGYICMHGERIGTLNLITGEYSLDLAKLSQNVLSSTNGEGSVAMDNSSVRIVYSSALPKLSSNRLQLYLGEATTGFVKEGENTIVAFYDLDGDGKYTYGEPFGTTVADVGWNQGAAEIELTDTTPIITRADLLQAASDRSALYGLEDGDERDLTPGVASGGKYERIRVIRTLVNGIGIQTLNMENRVIFDKVINLDQRSYFYEGDVLEDGSFDIDWTDFQSEVMGNVNVRNGNVDPMAVTYRIVMGNGTISVSDTNNLYSIATTRHFDANGARTRPVAQAPGSQSSAVFGSRPVFKWTMKTVNPETGAIIDNNSYTAFKVQVRDGSSVVYDSGIRRAPARDLNGVYTFVPDVYAGDLLEPEKNYTWRVSMYNSKFRSDFWSDEGNNTFRMNALTNSLGTINVCAKYFGPANVLAGGVVRIEAFTTPDFSGDPVARTYVRTKSAVSAAGVEHAANATLVGLTAGKYYVRGYIDLSSYGDERFKDSWESWGYVCQRDGETTDIFMPTTIVIDDKLGQGDVFDLYIEDVDTNGNCLPDAWETIQNRGRLDNGTENLNDTLNSGIEINQTLVDNLQNKEMGTPAGSGLAAYVFSVMSNSGVAALILDADTEAHSSYTLAAAASAGTLTTVTTPQEVEVTTIAAEDASVTLAIKGSATVKTESTKNGKQLLGSGAKIYTTDGTVDTTGKLVGVVEYTLSLSNPNWTPTDTRVLITVAEDGSFVTEPFDVPKPSGGEEAAFFRIKLQN